MKRYLVFCHCHYDETQLLAQSNSLETAKNHILSEPFINISLSQSDYYVADMKKLLIYYYQGENDPQWEIYPLEIKDLDKKEEE